jgi:hypothetical protein
MTTLTNADLPTTQYTSPDTKKMSISLADSTQIKAKEAMV